VIDEFRISTYSPSDEIRFKRDRDVAAITTHVETPPCKPFSVFISSQTSVFREILYAVDCIKRCLASDDCHRVPIETQLIQDTSCLRFTNWKLFTKKCLIRGAVATNRAVLVFQPYCRIGGCASAAANNANNAGCECKILFQEARRRKLSV